jgi:flavin-dependent dehydrogenase
VIERDKLNRERPEHRPGVPQSWHIHSLMLRGQHELEALFPGVCEKALELGAVRIDRARDMVVWSKYGWWPRYDSGLVPLCATRTLLEFAERSRFFALTKNAIVLDDTRVLELIAEPQRGGHLARGVVTSHPDYPNIQADLVIDCTGRAARWKEWFKQRSVSLPRETIVDAGCGYASRLYRPHDADEFSWKAMVSDTAFPTHPRYGAIIPVEDGQWLVTLGCFNAAYPPTDEDGYLDFARSLATPLFAQALERAEPLSKVRSSRKHEMHWNHFESYSHPVSHYIILGDSAWSYNPHYAQGMTVALSCARILGELAAEKRDLTGLAKRYYRQAKKFAWQQWSATAQLDRLWGGEQDQNICLKLYRPMNELILSAAAVDPVVSRALLAGAHAIVTPFGSLTPDVIARVALHALNKLMLGGAAHALQSLPQPPAVRSPK